MTLLNGFRTVRNGLENPAVPMTSTALLDFLGIEKTHAGVRVDEIKAMGIPAVWRAVNVSSGVEASLPFHAFKQVNEQRVPATSATSKVIDDPHPDMTPFELWETCKIHRKLWGNAYLRKLRNPLGIVSELWLIHPSRVKVGRESEQGLKVYSIDGGKEVQIGDRNMLHIPGLGYDGICGVSPVRAARQSLGLTIAAEEYGAKLFGSGSLATGILQTEQRLTQDQADALASRWRSKRSGLDHAHETIILDRGAKFEQLTIPPEDAQFLESRMFQISEICRWFGIPPFLMFQTEKSTSWGTGLEQQLLGWIMIDLRPDLTRFEQRITKGLELQTLNEPEYSKYALEGLLRGDSAARSAFYKTMWEMGVFSTNEIRALEDKGPVDGGDARYRPLNFGKLGEFDTTAQEAPTNA